MAFTPYIFFGGDCREAFELYQRVLGGRITAMMTHVGTPVEDQVPEHWRDKILHACLEVDGRQLMASDSPPDRRRPPGGYAVHFTAKGPDDAERIFHALADGGSVTMPIAPTFWAQRFGMLVDRFGTLWMITTPSAA